MKITYIVRQPDDPVTTEVKGFRFMAGAETEVDDPEVIETLSGNPWFRIEGAAQIRGSLSPEHRDPTPMLIKRKPGRPRIIRV